MIEFENVVINNGFTDLIEFNNLVSNFVLDTLDKVSDFKKWQQTNGTKKELLELYNKYNIGIPRTDN